MKNGRGFGLFFLGIGLLVAAITWSIAIVGLVERSDWVKTEGTIVEVFETRDRDSGNRRYGTVVEFQAGSETKTCDSNSRSSARPETGGTETVAYDPASPSKCQVDDARWLTWILFGMGGVFLVVFGLVGVSILRGNMTMRRTRSSYGRGVRFTDRGEQGAYHDGHSSNQHEQSSYRYEGQASDQPKSADELRRDIDEAREKLKRMTDQPPQDGPPSDNPYGFDDGPPTWR